VAKGGYQKRRIQAKKEAERAARARARRNKTIMRWLVGVGAVALAGVVVLLALGGDDKPSFASSPTPTPSTSTSATPTSNPTPQLAFPTPCTSFGSNVVGEKKFSKPPCKVIDESKTYTATLKTNLGTIEVELFASQAPVTVNNFVFLARTEFFDGSLWHRVIPDFAGKAMIQGGDPVNKDGTGGPGYQFGDENMVAFDAPGFLAMANSGPGTNGSQFFILEGTVQHLNAPGNCGGNSGCHTVFGKVTKGLDVVHKIAAVKTGENDKPAQDVILEKVTIKES
jgi:peptidyl-prolyl cis-trans isomerase B (cyclophilin B)